MITKLSFNHVVCLCLATLIVAIISSYYLGQEHSSFSQLSELFYDIPRNEEESQMKEDTLYSEGSDAESIMSQHRVDSLKRIDVLITFTNVKSNYALQEKFRVTVTSMLSLTSTPIALYILGDMASQQVAENILKEYLEYDYTIVRLDIDNITRELYDIVKDFQNHFSVKQSYYHDALFYMSVAIHRVLPDNLHRIIMLDADLKFNADIKELYHLFSDFSESNVMGIARDAQPVYRHQFATYRSANRGTRVGGPPPDGLTGFNSGVLLLDLKKMRRSNEYNSHISVEVVEKLRKKYSFSGHLGDQCFFTLLSLEHEDLFYILPCTWNRQLCEWWRGKGYDDVFDLYFRCDGHINIYHGNCNTKIPDIK